MYLFFLFVLTNEANYATEVRECICTVNRGKNQRSP